MRELLRHLASTGKTVFVSSHLLAEVRQMADIVGIISTGRLVREGPINELLKGEGSVRVRVAGDQVDAALPVLGRFGKTSAPDADHWIEVETSPDTSADLNAALAQAGIYAAELHVGSGLESLFLELTQGADSAEGSFQAIPTGAPPA
jgi:ABC-2 type transport system ATP-binding protein